MFEVRKIHKRLHIFNETGQSVYSPPDFVRLPDRKSLIQLAEQFNKEQQYSITAVIEFETKYTMRKKYAR